MLLHFVQRSLLFCGLSR